MKTLMIKDLAVTEELDGKAMAAVHGGMYKDKGASSYAYPQLGLSKSEFNFDASQLLSQTQTTEVNNGNNVAFADCITATVTPHQTGTNTINFK